MGAEVTLCDPPHLIPIGIKELGVSVSHNVDEVVEWADVLNILRIQRERMGVGLIPSVREYRDFFGITQERLDRHKKEIVIMHPGPMNRGVEIDSKLADDITRSLIQEQVTMGVAIRMACLEILINNNYSADNPARSSVRYACLSTHIAWTSSRFIILTGEPPFFI